MRVTHHRFQRLFDPVGNEIYRIHGAQPEHFARNLIDAAYKPILPQMKESATDVMQIGKELT
jgi:hypothetical protein